MNRRPTPEQLATIVTNRLDGHPPREFQTSIAESDASVTLVEAGCGSGKTVAAYMWVGQQHPGRRLWFCYPTTGTATAGFQGYLLDAESKSTNNPGVIDGDDLFHSRQQYDKLRMLGTRELDDQMDDTSVRVESLKAWDTKIVACTVDSLLLILQNQRRGLYAWPAISQSAIVFDEVHSYDDVLFGNLLTFLRELSGIPALLMTASLPISRREAIDTSTKIKAQTSGRLDGGMETPVDTIRAASYGVSVIRENNLRDIRQDRSVVADTLPMNYPVSDNWKHFNMRSGGFPVVSETAIDYCSKTGAVWSTFVIL